MIRSLEKRENVELFNSVRKIRREIRRARDVYPQVEQIRMDMSRRIASAVYSRVVRSYECVFCSRDIVFVAPLDTSGHVRRVNCRFLGPENALYRISSFRILACCCFYFPTTMVLMYCYGSAFHVNKLRLKRVVCVNAPEVVSGGQIERVSHVYSLWICTNRRADSFGESWQRNLVKCENEKSASVDEWLNSYKSCYATRDTDTAQIKRYYLRWSCSKKTRY